MATSPRDIPQRELRNDVGRVLRDVEGGAVYRVTVSGRPVADIVPIRERSAWVPRADFEEILRSAPLDPGFPADVDGVLDETIDEL